MDDPTAAAYLARIGANVPTAPTLDALRHLSERHLCTVPFETLSIHLGEPVELAENALVDKIVRRRRGGFCYELNGLFAALLVALGYRVDLLACRVFLGDDHLGPPLDHLALRVHLARPWLVDVGFGRHAVYPLDLSHRGVQPDPDGGYEIRPAGGFGDLDVLRDGHPQYRVENRPRELSEFTAMCWWQAHSPESGQSRVAVCSMLTPVGRVTLRNGQLITTTGDGRAERDLSDAESLAAYRDIFGIRLDRLPSAVPSVAARS